MLKVQEEIVNLARQSLNHGLSIKRVEDGLIFKHRNAAHFVAEVNLRTARLTVPLTAEFLDHPGYSEDELVEHALQELGPSLTDYKARGYQLREMEWRPAHQSEAYDESQIPIFVAFMERQLEDWDELFEELPWLIDRLPQR